MRDIYITCKDESEARLISKTLLEKKLVACSNFFPIKSMYWWKGEIQDDSEFAIILKTRDENFEKVESEVKKLHSYSVPCIVSWKIEKGSKYYLDWLRAETESPR